MQIWRAKQPTKCYGIHQIIKEKRAFRGARGGKKNNKHLKLLLYTTTIISKVLEAVAAPF